MTNRPGVTLTELMVALGIFALLLATSLGFYQQQGRAFSHGNERMTLMQSLRFGVNTVEQNVRTAGIGVPPSQPVIVYADRGVLVFNGDYASSDPADPFAVYRDPGLPPAATSAAGPASRFVLPGTAVLYPDSAYRTGTMPSPAETITFFFEPDTTTTRIDDFALYRQVNGLEPEIVGRRLLPTSRPFFTYYVVDPWDTGTPVGAVPEHRLPAWHAAPIHGSPADTGRSALADSIRAVEVAYAVTNGLTGVREQRREIRRLIRIPNAGLETRRVCGNPPLLGTSLIAVASPPSGDGEGHIHLQWGQATDERSGEEDVLRYVVWRRESGATDWGVPLVSLSAGSSLYEYDDYGAQPGVQYVYALAAQDCTPAYSPLSVTGRVSW